jgi:hypothetical protein
MLIACGVIPAIGVYAQRFFNHWLTALFTYLALGFTLLGLLLWI